jgi:hypothetical protein
MNDDWDDFYEDDEPLGKILAAWNAAVAEGRTDKTAQPSGDGCCCYWECPCTESGAPDGNLESIAGRTAE